MHAEVSIFEFKATADNVNGATPSVKFHLLMCSNMEQPEQTVFCRLHISSILLKYRKAACIAHDDQHE